MFMDENHNHYKLAIFDIDGTLTEIKPEVLESHPRLVTPNRLGEQQPIPGVVEKLAELKKEGLYLALATNRGGVAFGYTTLEEARALAAEAAVLCSIPDAKIFVCPYHVKAHGPRTVSRFTREDACRKPNSGMLQEAMAAFEVQPQSAFFVGDKATDQQAAENAGIDFYWASEFFNRQERK